MRLATNQNGGDYKIGIRKQQVSCVCNRYGIVLCLVQTRGCVSFKESSKNENVRPLSIVNIVFLPAGEGKSNTGIAKRQWLYWWSKNK